MANERLREIKQAGRDCYGFFSQGILDPISCIGRDGQCKPTELPALTSIGMDCVREDSENDDGFCGPCCLICSIGCYVTECGIAMPFLPAYMLCRIMNPQAPLEMPGLEAAGPQPQVMDQGVMAVELDDLSPQIEGMPAGGEGGDPQQVGEEPGLHPGEGPQDEEQPGLHPGEGPQDEEQPGMMRMV